MEMLWFIRSHELPHALIARLAGVSENTLREYFQFYEEGGIERLKEVHFYHPRSELHLHMGTLEAHFRAHPPATIKEAQSEIEALNGIWPAPR